MRALQLCLLVATSSALAFGPASAQMKAAPKGASNGIETRYFTAIDGLLDGNADVILRETRQGRTVTGATLDVCYAADNGSERKDRFVVDLAVNGAVMTGTTQTLIDKYPVAVRLTRKQTGDSFEFSGEVKVGQTVNNVTSSDNTDLSEDEFRANQPGQDAIATAPADFTDVSPEAVAVRVKLDSALEFIKSLRGEKVEIVLGSLNVSCEALRSGEQIVNVNIDPARAAAFVAKAKTFPGVVSAGWTSGAMDLERMIRFAAAPWRDGDRLSRDKIATTIAGVLGKHFSAKLTGTGWDATTGLLKLTLQRPSPIAPALNLTETLEFTAAISPERPGSSENLLLWISAPASTTTDEADGPRLTVNNATNLEEEINPRDDQSVVKQIASEFKAKRWNNDKADWD